MISAIGSSGLQANYLQRAARAPSHEEMFTRMDTNGDGQIDQSELETMLQQAPPMDGARPTPPPKSEPLDAAELIEQFDRDGNGTLNADEATEMGEYLRAQMEAQMEMLIARLTQESQQSGLLLPESDDQASSNQHATSALQTYATQAANTLSGSLLNALG